MATLEKSKKASKKQKIDRKSNLEQEKIKNLIHRSEVCKMENKKGKKSEGPSPLGERGARRAEDSSLSSHHFSQQ